MQGNFQPVESRDALEQVVEQSRETPVLLFKHDTKCPISAAAYREMAQLEDAVALLDVAQDELSQEVEARTGVRHESPQVIVLVGGRVAWHASHRRVTAKVIRQAVERTGSG